MCASYGLQFNEESHDERLSTPDLVEWLQQHVEVKLGTTRSLEKGPFSPLITPNGMELAWWWLWVRGAPAKQTAFNAKSENLNTSPLWRQPYRSGRVLIPASYYFESANVPNVTGRYRFEIPGIPMFAIAGITAPIGRDGYPRLSFAMVTRAPTPLSAQVHDRMPLLLPQSMYDAWLDPEREGDEALVAEAVDASDELARQLVYAPVS